MRLSTTRLAHALGPTGQAAVVGLALTLMHLGFVLAVSAQPDLPAAYRALVQWDSVPYAELVDQGYHRVDRPELGIFSNVAYFPGYPLLARAIKRLLALDTEVALLVAAQLAWWLFWTYVYRLFQHWRVPTSIQVTVTVAMLSHPTAFFAVSAYTESLFMAGFLGLIFWTASNSRFSWAWAGLHGAIMTGTRITGLPLALYPIWRDLVGPLIATAKLSLPRLRSLIIVACTSLGAGSFFAYCYVRFGHWDEVIRTQQRGWNLEADYLAIFRASTYQFPAELLRTASLNRLLVIFTMALFLSTIVAEICWRRVEPNRWRPRAALYIAAGLMFYLYISVLAGVDMISMVRYIFPIHTTLLLAYAHFFASSDSRVARLKPVFRVALLGLSAAGLGVQAHYARNFSLGIWVG